MEKYTKQQVLDEKISFKPMTEEQHGKLKAHFGYGPAYEKGWYYRFFNLGSSFTDYGKSDSSYLGSFYLSSTKEISFEEFDFEEVVDSKTVLPDVFYVLAYSTSNARNSNIDLITYLKLLGVKTSPYTGNIPRNAAYLIIDNLISEAIFQSEMKNCYPSYTLEQLKQLVNNKKKQNNEKHEKHEQKTVIDADSRGKGRCIARQSRSPRQITLGKRFVGNTISAKSCKTRTISVKIQPNIISF
jgi:hypothetical protein